MFPVYTLRSKRRRKGPLPLVTGIAPSVATRQKQQQKGNQQQPEAAADLELGAAYRTQKAITTILTHALRYSKQRTS